MSKLNSPTARLALLAFCLIGLGFLTDDPESVVLWFVLFAVLADIFYFVIEIKSVGRIVFWRHLCKYRHDFASFDGIFRTSWICGFGTRMRDIPQPIVLYHPGKKNEFWKTMAGSSPPGVA